jgi:hypothetical protein
VAEHAVQLYQDEPDLAEALARYAQGGLAAGEGVVVIGSTPRWNALGARLRAMGVDAHAAVLRGQLRLFSAKTILTACMVRGMPESLAFNQAIGALLDLVRMRYPALRVFGELTDILWSQKERTAAMAVERLWGALTVSQNFSLLCACPLDSLDGRSYEGQLQSVCALHTHLVPAADCNAFNEAVTGAIREVLEPQLVGMLHSLSAQHRPVTQMPMGQAVMLWLRQNMPRTAERVLARARARL